MNLLRATSRAQPCTEGTAFYLWGAAEGKTRERSVSLCKIHPGQSPDTVYTYVLKCLPKPAGSFL